MGLAKREISRPLLKQRLVRVDKMLLCKFPLLNRQQAALFPVIDDSMGQDLNAQHQQVTKTNEGVWAANSGSISADEAALSSTKPAFAGDPSLMPHQG